MSKMTIQDLLKTAAENVTAGSADALLKTAHEQGINDAERVVKIASYTGDIMGNSAFETFHGCIAASLGFDPEVYAVKTASIADLIDAAMITSLTKIAENYSPQTGGANLETTQAAAADQLREAGKAHAMLAAQSANDAVASVDNGDPNTALQSMQTAGENILLARQAAEVVEDPELEAQVAQASDIVTQAAEAIQAQG